MTAPLMDVYRTLFEAFGPQRWWPGETPFEVMVGAVLTQNTNWNNVERAIQNLREADLLSPRALHETAPEELEELIRPAGYYRVKARRLKALVDYLIGQHADSLEAMFSLPPDELRQELLAIHGIGPETADSILLYAGNLPSFVVDAYTARVLVRHGWIDRESDYHQIQEFFHDALPQDAVLFNEYHALFVHLGKHFCRKTGPKCETCPLKPWLPPGGPLELEG
ncbi:MAG: endonuclease III domain-containing protein [Planctomycetota bacterium]